MLDPNARIAWNTASTELTNEPKMAVRLPMKSENAEDNVGAMVVVVCGGREVLKQWTAAAL